MMTYDDEMMTSKGRKDIFSKILILGADGGGPGQGLRKTKTYILLFIFLSKEGLTFITPVIFIFRGKVKNRRR